MRAYKHAADEMRERPGEERRLASYPVNNRGYLKLVAAIREGTSPSFEPTGAFEARFEQESGTVQVYATYTGKERTDGPGKSNQAQPLAAGTAEKVQLELPLPGELHLRGRPVAARTALPALHSAPSWRME